MKLGSLSAKYESNGNPSTVSTGIGDAGGVSYGMYQFTTNTGGVKDFIKWLYSTNHPSYSILCRHVPGSREFSSAWIYCAENYDDFGDIQHKYTEYIYYKPAIEKLRNVGFNIENHNVVMKDVVWSRAVQYGTKYIVEMFEDACKILGYPNLSYVDAANFDKDMIKSIYLNVCRSEEWTNGSPSLRKNLYSRFENECNDALNKLC